jgi:homoserine kinase type II
MAILTKVSEDELRALAGAFDLGPLSASRGIEAGTVNTSYALEMASGRYFLRIYEEQQRPGAEAEARLLLHLAASGVPTPAPVQARDGSMVQLLCAKPAAIFPWVVGDMLCLKAVTPAAAHAVGGALARMHLAGPAEPAATSLGAGRFGADELVARCDRILKATDAEARSQAEPLRDAVILIDRKRKGDLPRGLVHGDLFRDNVLWHDGKIAALLDFESAHRGPFAYDLAVLVLSWSFRDSFDMDVARAIVAGYREVRELEANERESLYVESVFAALRFTITRITDDAIRVGKKWQRFVARREAIEKLGPAGLREALGL